jgi:hypothetical protein
MKINLESLSVRPITKIEEPRYRELMQQHHYLGDLAKIDPTRFHGTVYRAANWHCVGQTQGFRRSRAGYNADDNSPKLVFVRPLQADAQAQLARALLAHLRDFYQQLSVISMS